MDLRLEITLAHMFVISKFKQMPPDAFYQLAGNDKGRFAREGAMIVPDYKLVKQIFTCLFEPLLSALAGLERNVTFLQTVMPRDLEMFRVSCDWCSICNGLIHTAVENIKRTPQLILTVDRRIEVISRFLGRALRERREKVTVHKIIQWSRATFGATTTAHLTLAKIYLQLEQVELRWCPFKRSRKFYYRNRDSRFVIPSLRNIQVIGRVLAEDETVTCERCPQLVNERLPTEAQTSVFQPLLDLMLARRTQL